MVFAGVVSFAQHPSVQGVPRPGAKNSVKSEPAVVYPNIDFGMIEYWVGEGENEAALVVKWDDGKGGNKNLVWGYYWDDEEDGTGEAMLRAVAKEDPRFYMLVYGNTQYGAAIGGMGYDLNGNGNIALVKGGTSFALTDGVYKLDFQRYGRPLVRRLVQRLLELLGDQHRSGCFRVFRFGRVIEKTY